MLGCFTKDDCLKYNCDYNLVTVLKVGLPVVSARGTTRRELSHGFVTTPRALERPIVGTKRDTLNTGSLFVVDVYQFRVSNPTLWCTGL